MEYSKKQNDNSSKMKSAQRAYELVLGASDMMPSSPCRTNINLSVLRAKKLAAETLFKLMAATKGEFVEVTHLFKFKDDKQQQMLKMPYTMKDLEKEASELKTKISLYEATEKMCGFLALDEAEYVSKRT